MTEKMMPTSNEVDEVVKYFVEYYLPEVKITHEVSQTTIQNIETLIKAAQVRPPQYVVAAGASNPEDFNDMKPGQVVFSSDAPQFTREELEPIRKVCTQIKLMAYTSAGHDQDTMRMCALWAGALEKAIIDIGAVRVRENKDEI